MSNDENKRTPLPDVVIHTDGGCVPNPGPGGWAALLQYGDVQKELSGGAPQTTNNQMELTAAIEALAALKKPCPVALYTDSQYLRRGITEWLKDWKKRVLENRRQTARQESRPRGTPRSVGHQTRHFVALGQRPRRPCS